MPSLRGVASSCVPPWRGQPFRVLKGAVGVADVARKALVAT